MDKPNGQSRVRSLPGPVILCVLGAVCTFPCAYAQAQQSAAPGNDKDIDFTPQAGKVWSCTIDGCTSNPNIYTDQDIAAWDLKAADYAESCETFDYDYNTAFEDGFYAAVLEVGALPSVLPLRVPRPTICVCRCTKEPWKTHCVPHPMIFSAVPELECFGSGPAVESHSETASVHGATVKACSWQTDCKNPDCEGKCIVNIYQDLNDQAAPSPGQMDHNQDTIARDTKLAWGLTCPMIASTVYRYADKHAKGRPVLDSLKELSAPGMACPTEADIDRVVTDINLTHKNYKDTDAPYNTNADDMIWPFSYAAATEGNGEPFMGYIGTVEELKAMLKERCQTAVVSDALMNLAVANGVWQYSFLLEDQGFSMSELRGGTTGGDAMSEKSEPDAGLTICRDNRGLLENLLSFAVAKPNQADQVMAAVTDLPHGQCFGVRSASQLALDVPWLSFGDERSCEEETAVSLRTLHEACAKLTTKERCVQARFEDDQRLTVSYMNAMDSEVSTSTFTDPCMASFMNPWSGEVLDPQTTNEIARQDLPANPADAAAADADAEYDDGYGEYDDGEYEADGDWEADYGEDTTEGVYYGDEDVVDDAQINSEDGIGQADETGIGEADAEAIGTAAFETRSGAHSVAAAVVAVLAAAVCAAVL